MDDSKNNGDVDDVDDDIERRRRRRDCGGGFLSQYFVVEYFTTRMEADANDIDGEPTCCRGIRPRRSGAVPTLADVIGGGATTKRWLWQFWKQG
jgi:hypothetical protein